MKRGGVTIKARAAEALLSSSRPSDMVTGLAAKPAVQKARAAFRDGWGSIAAGLREKKKATTCTCEF